MSHVYGKVEFEDGECLYYEYSGTGDFIINPLFLDEKMVSDTWRRDRTEAEGSSCGCVGEPVVISTSYGNGFSWKGHACRSHMKITEGFEPFDYTEDEV